MKNGIKFVLGLLLYKIEKFFGIYILKILRDKKSPQAHLITLTLKFLFTHIYMSSMQRWQRGCQLCGHLFVTSSEYRGDNPKCRDCRRNERRYQRTRPDYRHIRARRHRMDRLMLSILAAAAPASSASAAAPVPSAAAPASSASAANPVPSVAATSTTEFTFRDFRDRVIKETRGALIADWNGNLHNRTMRNLFRRSGPHYAIVKWLDGRYGASIRFSARKESLDDLRQIIGHQTVYLFIGIKFFGVVEVAYLDGTQRRYLIGMCNCRPYLYNRYGHHPVQFFDDRDTMMASLLSYEQTLTQSERRRRESARHAQSSVSTNSQQTPSVVVGSSDEELERFSREEQETKSNESTDSLCVICLERKKTAVALPCSHMVSCAACALELKRRASGHVNCPLCRKPVANFLRVFT